MGGLEVQVKEWGVFPHKASQQGCSGSDLGSLLPKVPFLLYKKPSSTKDW